MLFNCNCKNEYQDKIYGKGQRVHTPTNKGHRCTVCGNMRSDSSSSKKK